MNAIKFIKQHGIEKARKVVEGAPDLAEYYSTIDGEYYRIELHAVNLRHLKRLVESLDMLKRFGGIELSKEWILEYSSFPYRVELEQAIADYEQLFGNSETLGGESL